MSNPDGKTLEIIEGGNAPSDGNGMQEVDRVMMRTAFQSYLATLRIGIPKAIGEVDAFDEQTVSIVEFALRTFEDPSVAKEELELAFLNLKTTPEKVEDGMRAPDPRFAFLLSLRKSMNNLLKAA